jgi:TRAP transporter TAXI family solute receptor
MRQNGFFGKRLMAGLSIVCALILVLAACGNTGSGSAKNGKSGITLGTGDQGGVFYPVGVGFADILSKNGMTVTPEVTGASLDNAVLLGNKEVEMAIITAGDIVTGKNGEKPFKNKIDNISVMFGGLKPGGVQVLALKKSGIKSITDLKGKRVSVGPQGGSGWKAFSEMLPYYGMSLDDIKPSYISYGDSIDQLTDGAIDASVIVAGTPTPAVVQLATKGDFVIVPFDADKLTKFLEEHKYYTTLTIPKDMYKGMDADIKTYATNNVFAVRDDVSDDIVYNSLKILFEHVDEFRNMHASIKTISVETASSFKGYRYHPGAVKFFKEKGIEVPAK